jgi:hypothetical protein
MFKSLTVSTLILGSVLAFAQPQLASARDRDEYRYHRRERERYEHRYDHHRYDRHRGYYDRWGNWHWY